ncbi:MAG: hypothetical protein ACRDBG_24685 [Waterburya sp.]
MPFIFGEEMGMSRQDSSRGRVGIFVGAKLLPRAREGSAESCFKSY